MSHEKSSFADRIRGYFRSRKKKEVVLPFATIALRARIKFLYIVIVGFTMFVFTQEYLFFKDKKLLVDKIEQANARLDQRKWLVVQPNIPVQSAAPNSIPPDVVGSYFNFVAGMLTKFTWRDVEVTYKYLGTFLNRDFRVNFRNQWQSQLDSWVKDNYEQISHLNPLKEYYIEGHSIVGFFEYEVDRWISKTPISPEIQYLVIYLTTENVTKPKLGAPIEIVNFEFLDKKSFLKRKTEIEAKNYKSKSIENMEN